MYGQKVAEALQGLCAAAGCSCGLRRSCNDSISFQFSYSFQYSLLVTLPGLSIFLSILLAFQSTLRLAVDSSVWLGFYFSFLLAWICLLSLLPCNVEIKVMTMTLGIVDISLTLFLFLI